MLSRRYDVPARWGHRDWVLDPAVENAAPGQVLCELLIGRGGAPGARHAEWPDSHRST